MTSNNQCSEICTYIISEFYVCFYGIFSVASCKNNIQVNLLIFIDIKLIKMKLFNNLIIIFIKLSFILL